jgi:hypothetical protein
MAQFLSDTSDLMEGNEIKLYWAHTAVKQNSSLTVLAFWRLVFLLDLTHYTFEAYTLNIRDFMQSSISRLDSSISALRICPSISTFYLQYQRFYTSFDVVQTSSITITKVFDIRY